MPVNHQRSRVEAPKRACSVAARIFGVFVMLRSLHKPLDTPKHHENPSVVASFGRFAVKTSCKAMKGTS